MQLVHTNDSFNGFHASGCTLCKCYWLATLGGPDRAMESVHASRGTACGHAELARGRGVRFLLAEIPALFFPCDDERRSVYGSAGLVITETMRFDPMSVHGAVSLARLDVRSVIAQFVREPSRLFVRRTSADMPALAGPLRAWKSRSRGVRQPLDWECANRRISVDLSHLESLRMRLDQQVRALAGTEAAAEGV